MRAFRHSFQLALRALLLPFGIASFLCVLALGFQPPLDGMGADRAAGMWLYLPGLILMLAALTAAVDGWPLFSRDRAGADWLERTTPGPWQGCASAAAGTLLALALYLGLAAVSFLHVASPWTATEIEAPRAQFQVELQSETSRLRTAENPVEFEVRHPGPAQHLRIRVFGLFGRDTSPTPIQVLADGACVHPDDPWITTTGGILDLPLSAEPQTVRAIQVRRRTNQGIHLSIAPEDCELTGPVEGFGGMERTINGVLASWVFLAPALLGMAVMILGHRFLALPVNLGAGAGIGLLAVLLGWAPVEGVEAFARGHWLPAEPGVFRRFLPVGAVTVALLGLTAATKPGTLAGNRVLPRGSNP